MNRSDPSVILDRAGRVIAADILLSLFIPEVALTCQADVLCQPIDDGNGCSVLPGLTDQVSDSVGQLLGTEPWLEAREPPRQAALAP